MWGKDKQEQKKKSSTRGRESDRRGKQTRSKSQRKKKGEDERHRSKTPRRKTSRSESTGKSQERQRSGARRAPKHRGRPELDARDDTAGHYGQPVKPKHDAGGEAVIATRDGPLQTTQSQGTSSLRSIVDSADILFKQRKFDEARKMYNKALKNASRTGEKIIAADALVRIANIYEGQGNLSLASAAQENALRIYDLERKAKASVATEDDALSFAVIAADNLAGLGNLNVQLGEMAEAKYCYQEALMEIKEIETDATNEIAINLHKKMGKLLSEMDDHNAAMGAYTEALQLERQLHGEAHPAYAETLCSLGEIMLEQGQKEKALEAFKESLMIYRVNDMGNDHPNVTSVTHNIYRAKPPQQAAEEPKVRGAFRDLFGAINLECKDYACAS